MSGPLWLTMVLAWLVPGAAHARLGRVRKAAIFFVVLTTMFVIGIAFGGRLFTFDIHEPLVFLAAVSEWLVLVPRLFAAMAGLGVGDAVAATYEFGNTFIIVAGLLNALVVLDAMDIARGRKP